jgi:hypothetical protein
MSSKAMIMYFAQHGSSSVFSNLAAYPARITGAIHWGFFSFNDTAALILFFLGALYLLLRVKRYKKNMLFLLIWIFSTLPLFFFKSGVLTAEVSNSSIFGALTISAGFIIYDLFSDRKLKWAGALIFGIIILSNLTLFVRNDFKDQNIFIIQSLVLGEEKQAVDYTYSSSRDKDFSVCALTNPLTINTLWSFLYKYYGEKKYGYIPYWSGKKQFLNASYMPYDENHSKQRYLIIEPPGGFPEFTKTTTVYQEDQISLLGGEKNFGLITVQKRELSPNKGEERDTQGLSHQDKQAAKDLLSYEQSYSCYNTY